MTSFNLSCKGKLKESFSFTFCIKSALGNYKDCDKRISATGKLKETIQEIIIHDNLPGIQ